MKIQIIKGRCIVLSFTQNQNDIRILSKIASPNISIPISWINPKYSLSTITPLFSSSKLKFIPLLNNFYFSKLYGRTKDDALFHCTSREKVFTKSSENKSQPLPQTASVSTWSCLSDTSKTFTQTYSVTIIVNSQDLFFSILSREFCIRQRFQSNLISYCLILRKNLLFSFLFSNLTLEAYEKSKLSLHC